MRRQDQPPPSRPILFVGTKVRHILSRLLAGQMGRN